MIFSSEVHGQRETENWLFGNGVWINFQGGGSPVNVTSPASAMNVTEGCASFSDTSGNLMFYTNGITVWDRTHVPMPNGQNLHGDNSSSQSAIVVPKPGASYGYFYVFTIDADGGPDGLKYSEIDMSLNGGLGDVTQKNIPLIAPTSEKVTAVRHGLNINEWWIVTHEWNTDRFFAYHVSAAGVNTTPVISAVGEVHAIGAPPFILIESHGYLKASPDGSKIASAVPGPGGRSRVEIFDFDNLTGVISNPVKLSGFRDPYGIEFSPSGQYLYVALLHQNDTVLQYDITQANIASTKQVIGITQNVYLCAMQLAPDGKIYICRYDDDTLAAIDNPNLAGAACGFNVSALPLTATCKQGLPNFFTNVFLNADFVYQDTCFNAPTVFAVTYSGADSVKWDFGDPASGVLNIEYGDTTEHIYTSTGNYNVECIVYDLGLTDTVRKTITINPLPDVYAGADTAICTNNNVVFTAVSTNATSFIWHDMTVGAAYNYISFNPGTETIWVNAYLNGCMATDSIHITSEASPLLDLGSDTILCGVSQYVLDANAAGNSNIISYEWQDGSSQQYYSVTASGLYIVTLENTGCSVTDSVLISLNTVPTVNLGADIELCEGETAWIPVITIADSVLWHDGSMGDSVLFTAAAPGNFTVTVAGTSDGCTAYDTLSLQVNAFPAQIDLGPDITACEGETVTLISPVSGTWQDGTVSASYPAVQSGIYYIVVTQNNCSTSDSVEVEFEEAPSLFANTDTLICDGDVIVLDLSSNPPGFSFQWNDGFPDPIRVLTEAGSYAATVTAGNCSVTSQYILNVITEPEIYLGEDSVICFGGVLTLDATYPYSSYLWQDGSTEPVITASQSGTYGVQATNQCGAFVDSVKLEFVECRCHLFFPSAFTPNRDNKNDVYNYKYECNEFVPELKIFNRWGTLMFESKDPSLGWDGTYNGKEAVADAYIYVVKYIGVIDGVIGEQEKRGAFILIR